MNYEELAIAIVKQAAKDYRTVLRNGDQPSYTERELESFFKSKWFRQLADLDGQYLMERIKEHSKTTKRRKKKEAKNA